MMYGSGWWMGGAFGIVILVLVVGLIAWLAASVVRSPGTAKTSPPPDDARRILDERLARGDIDREEYLDRVAVLERR